MLHRVFADIGNACLWGGAAALLVLSGGYAVLARWGRRDGSGRRTRPTLEGVSIVGLALGIVIIYAPSLLALVSPGLNGFATKDWYFWLAVATVIWVLIFAVILNYCWDRVRRQRRRMSKENQ